MVRDRRACGEPRLEMHYATDRRYVLPAKMNARSIVSCHTVRGLLTPPSAPPLLSTFIMEIYPRPQADAYHRRFWADRSIPEPNMDPGNATQDSRPPAAPGGTGELIQAQGRTGWPAGTASCRPRDQRADEGWPTGPLDGPHGSMLVRLSPVRGRYPPDRPRISIVYPLPARGFRLLMRTPRQL
jgi:hypothetical protein